jgi:hypothetical protein
VIFALVLMIPKVNRLRRRKRSWNIIRVLMALAGAGMLVVSATHGSPLRLVFAGGLLLFALLVPEQRPAFSIDARVRELGALIAVDGGWYIDAAERRYPAKLFVGPDQLWVLDAALHVLLEIALTQIRMLVVEPSSENWRLLVHCENVTVEFIYEGNFAQHLAGVADATIRSRLNRELPVLR